MSWGNGNIHCRRLREQSEFREFGKFQFSISKVSTAQSIKYEVVRDVT